MRARLSLIVFIALIALLPPAYAAELPTGSGIAPANVGAIPRTIKEYNDLVSDQEIGGFSTDTIIRTAIQAFPDCLDFCIKAISIRVDINVFSVDVYFSPIIRHNNADFVVQSYPSLVANPTLGDFTNAPWKEWANVFGNLEYDVTRPVILATTGSVFGLGGGEVRVTKYGQEQSHQFKETDVIGSPYTLLPMLIDTQGNLHPTPDECATPGCLEAGHDGVGDALRDEIADREADEEGEDPAWYEKSPEELAEDAKQGIKNKIGEYGERIAQCANNLRCALGFLLPGELSRIFSLLDSIEQIVAAVERFQRAMSTVRNIAERYAGLAAPGISASQRIERLLCPSDVLPFTPYYLSGLDLFWRGGFIELPPTDAHKAAIIINPFSKDRVGPDGELWAHIYPRSGFVDHPHDAKHGVATAMRAMDILTEDPRMRLRWNANGIETGQWQMFYPLETQVCAARPDQTERRNLMGDFMYPGIEYRYAWHYWRTYECDTNETGSQVATLDIPDICL